MGFPAGRSRIGLVKGVVPMPKLPESGHRDKSGHCCIAQLFGIGLPAALAARELGRCPRKQQHFGPPGEDRPAQLFGFTPQAAGCSWQQFPGSRHQEDLHNCAGFSRTFQAAASLSTRHTLKKSC